MAMLEAHVRVSLGDFRLDAELEVPLDGIAVVFGPSGGGKTTLLRALAGVESGVHGRIVLDDEVWLDDARSIRVPAHRRRVAVVFQDSRLFPHLSVRSNLLYGWRRTPNVDQKLEPGRVFGVLDLEPLLGRRVGDLSGGERQKVAIGRALLASPRLLLMDEPLASLDVGRRLEILPFIERLPGEFAISILYVTHSLDEMLRLGSFVVLLDRGRIVARGPAERVSDAIDRLLGGAELDAGTVVAGVVAGYDAEYGLARLRFEGGELRVPSLPVVAGTARRVRIRSRDVALALDPPGRATFLNVLRGTVRAIDDVSVSDAEVALDVGIPLKARVTRRSAADLGLEPGTPIYALLKAVALEGGANEASSARPVVGNRGS